MFWCVSLVPDATCHAPITLPDISSYPVISADSHVEGTVACNNYTYYTLRGEP